MQLLKTLQSNNVKLPFSLGSVLGSGIDGLVFEDQLNKDRVIKISELFLEEETAVIDYFNLFQCLNLIQSRYIPYFATLHNFGPLYQSPLNTQDHHCKVIHFVIMEKLFSLSEDEKKVFHTVLSHEDAGKKKPASITALKSQLNELSMFLQFNKDKMTEFCYDVSFSRPPVIHLDIHERNIMKDSCGDFKLVDFDRLKRS